MRCADRQVGPWQGPLRLSCSPRRSICDPGGGGVRAVLFFPGVWSHSAVGRASWVLSAAGRTPGEGAPDVTLEAEENSLGWGGPRLPDWFHFPPPWPGSLHLPGRLGPGIVPTGEAWHAWACAWPGLGVYRAGREWLSRRLGRGHRQRHPLPGRGREGPPHLLPVLFPFQIFIHLS